MTPWYGRSAEDMVRREVECACASGEVTRVQTKTDSCGACTVVLKTRATTLDLADVNVVVNLAVSFEEALKLKAAVDEGIRRLNNLDRSPGKAGAKEGSKLTVKLGAGQQRIMVIGPRLQEFRWPADKGSRP